MNKYLLYAIAILGIMPLTMDIRWNKEILSGWIIMSLVSLLIKNIWIRGIFLWFIIRGVISYFTVFEARSYAIAHITLFVIFMYVLFYQFIVDKIEVTKILNTLCIIGIIQALVMFLQFCGIWMIMTIQNISIIYKLKYLVISHPFVNSTAIGLTCNTNMAGSLLALTIPAFLRADWWYFIPLILLILFISNCLGGIIPAIFVILLYMIMRFIKSKIVKTAFVILLIIILPLSLLIPNEGTKYRINKNIEIINKNLPHTYLIGGGLGYFEVMKKSLAHNEYIQMFSEGGLPLMILALGFIMAIFRKLYRKKDYEYSGILCLGIIVGMLNMGVNFLFHTPYCIIFLTYLGLADKLC